MNIWWLDALVVLILVPAASGLPLNKLRVDPRLVISLGQLHALDWVLTDRFPLLECLVGTSG